MSKQNKVNPGQYYVAGRLTPDDAARERMKQRRPADIRAAKAPIYMPEAPSTTMHAPDVAKADGQIRGTARPSAAAKARAAAPARPVKPVEAVKAAPPKARATTPTRTRAAAATAARKTTRTATRKAAPAAKRTSAAAGTRKAATAKGRATSRSRK